MIEMKVRGERAMERLGAAFAELLYGGLLITLDGPLGAGKTTLARGLGLALGIKRMSSPSFTLIKEYPHTNPPLAHADLYRLSPACADELHLEEYINDGFAVMVEWYSRMAHPFECHACHINITCPSPDTRTVRIDGLGLDLQKIRSAAEARNLTNGGVDHTRTG